MTGRPQAKGKEIVRSHFCTHTNSFAFSFHPAIRLFLLCFFFPLLRSIFRRIHCTFALLRLSHHSFALSPLLRPRFSFTLSSSFTFTAAGQGDSSSANLINFSFLLPSLLHHDKLDIPSPSASLRSTDSESTSAENQLTNSPRAKES